MELKLEFRNGRLRPVVLERVVDPRQNSYVETLQACLVAGGYLKDAGGIDGRFGPGTEAAVKRFQKDAGLRETGRVDPETARKLDEKVAELTDDFNQATEIEERIGTDEEAEGQPPEGQPPPGEQPGGDKQKGDKQKGGQPKQPPAGDKDKPGGGGKPGGQEKSGAQPDGKEKPKEAPGGKPDATGGAKDKKGGGKP
ncbi:MAG TPA: peptidoglycan-binding domain-containing protein [Longimicrobium sp.]|nr:peptidoglycan-binding domain-containing protein [Longimicrobium sp.]